MSDNISPDEVKRRLILFLSIPAEVWTDVLKLLPRRTLVQNIAPACFRLKEICDKNVKTVHVIENANQFANKLEDDDPEANEQLEHLAANGCQLAGQFKLSEVRIGEKSQAILRDCPDLFDGCKIGLDFKEKNKSSPLFVECLSQLEEAKPVVIRVLQLADQVADFWHHPTFQNCNRADLVFWPGLPDATRMATVMNIFDWLHHQPNGMDCDGAADQQVRGMIVWFIRPNHMDLLINRCSEDIQQSQQPSDRRPYVLSIRCIGSGWLNFGQFRQIENKSTGEVLLLDHLMDENGRPTNKYRLRRCLAKEAANGEEFYAEIFKQDYGADVFNVDEKILPKVIIG